uniref:Uncharacterized protein n=1 Tax=Arundo donax TaxID=35708 RepID=A0A0A9AMY5_ARUDO
MQRMAKQQITGDANVKQDQVPVTQDQMPVVKHIQLAMTSNIDRTQHRYKQDLMDST